MGIASGRPRKVLFSSLMAFTKFILEQFVLVRLRQQQQQQQQPPCCAWCISFVLRTSNMLNHLFRFFLCFVSTPVSLARIQNSLWCKYLVGHIRQIFMAEAKLEPVKNDSFLHLFIIFVALLKLSVSANTYINKWSDRMGERMNVSSKHSHPAKTITFVLGVVAAVAILDKIINHFFPSSLKFFSFFLLFFFLFRQKMIWASSCGKLCVLFFFTLRLLFSWWP